MIKNTSESLKFFLLLAFVFSTCVSARAGLNNFTDLIFLDEWLIERKIDLEKNEIKCRASIPSKATWFGARVRLGSENELIKPIWITLKKDQFIEPKLTKLKKLLDECRSGFIFLPDNQ